MNTQDEIGHTASASSNNTGNTSSKIKGTPPAKRDQPHKYIQTVIPSKQGKGNQLGMQQYPLQSTSVSSGSIRPMVIPPTHQRVSDTQFNTTRIIIIIIIIIPQCPAQPHATDATGVQHTDCTVRAQHLHHQLDSEGEGHQEGSNQGVDKRKGKRKALHHRHRRLRGISHARLRIQRRS